MARASKTKSETREHRKKRRKFPISGRSVFTLARRSLGEGGLARLSRTKRS